MARLSRRQVLRLGGHAGLALGLSRLAPAGTRRAAPARPAAPPARLPPRAGNGYRGWEDVYRQAWKWEKVARGTHLRANCFSACAFDLYLKDGIVWREEQAAAYARTGVPRPDYAPRGCQKGCSYSLLAVAPDRLRYPLERIGPRGSGRWRRVSWDEALTRLAEAILDAHAEGGPETVVYDNGTSNVDWGPSTLGEMRLFTLLGATLLDGFAGTGDLAMGARQTWGTSFVDGSSDDWFRADTLVFWHCNPVSTRIPDAHFATEARYRGTEVITVSPDYSPSAVHASLWVNPRPGTDAALALGLARELLARNVIDAPYVREQTDLPFLVRADTGRLLRESDLRERGRPDRFYLWDTRRDRLLEAPGTAGRGGSLRLGDVVPALAGRFRVRGRDGRMLEAVPLLERLRARLAAYTPERVAAITGVGRGTQQRLADRLASSPRFLIYASWGSCKAYHADLLQRALILLSALRGQQGRPGGGVRFAAWLPFDGADDILGGPRPALWQRLLLHFYTPPPRQIEDAVAKLSRTELTWTPSHLFLHVHAGLGDIQHASRPDPAFADSLGARMRAAIARGWLRPRPAADRPPRVLVASGVNPLRRWPLPQVVERVLWPKLRMIACIDTRLSTTGCKADLLLPAAGYYEKAGLKYAVALVPYIVPGEGAAQPAGESKPEWEIMARLAERIQERARARGVNGPAATIHERFSDGGRLGPHSDVAICDHILRRSSVTRGTTWEEALRLGAVPARSAGGWGLTSGIGSEIDDPGSLTPSRIHVEQGRPWPTLTGRQQFCIDHPWFEAADEVLPRWKPLPGTGERARPVLLTGSHTRWSIHAIWRGEPHMLRLQRGEPSMWMAERDAAARGVRDHDWVRVWNEHGSFRVRARLSPALPPGLAILDHAWEPYQFPGWRGNMEVVVSPFKPTHLVGDYGHLRERVFESGPVHVPRGVPVEIERVSPGRAGGSRGAREEREDGAPPWPAAAARAARPEDTPPGAHTARGGRRGAVCGGLGSDDRARPAADGSRAAVGSRGERGGLGGGRP